MKDYRQVVVRICLIAGLCLVIPHGCRKAPLSMSTIRPFQSAVEHYLAQHDMGLRVAAFRKLDAHGNHASAQVSLQDAEGAVGVKVRWTFEFEKRNGQWVAVGHRER